MRPRCFDRARARALLVTGDGLYGNGLTAAGRIAAATGAKVLAPYPLTRLERGAGMAPVERMHYIIEMAVDQLKEFRQLILVGASVPVAYFAYPGKNSVLVSPECAIFALAGPEENCAAALQALSAALSLATFRRKNEAGEERNQRGWSRGLEPERSV
jgi:acetolactate synthase-1/2/3 large subunit